MQTKTLDTNQSTDVLLRFTDECKSIKLNPASAKRKLVQLYNTNQELYNYTKVGNITFIEKGTFVQFLKTYKKNYIGVYTNGEVNTSINANVHSKALKSKELKISTNEHSFEVQTNEVQVQNESTSTNTRTIESAKVNVQVQNESTNTQAKKESTSVNTSVNTSTDVQEKGIGLYIEKTLKSKGYFYLSKSFMFLILIILISVETLYHASLLDRVLTNYTWMQCFGTASLLMTSVLVFTVNYDKVESNFSNSLVWFALYNWFMTTTSFLYQDEPTEIIGWIVKIIVPIAIAGSIFVFASLLKSETKVKVNR